ncbi:MAG: type VI secretion system protein ImpL [Geobacteraceae bacterium GWC2_58_44]|nr:MAG: type VI secretion system protein ImpL [Geobacteraceae bacterium GWC2_58_44]HBG06211.1 type VI secretion system protein ImpL [Geobacter sp.]
MKESISAMLKNVPFTAAGALALLLVMGFVLVFDWPWWVGLFLLLLLTGLVLGGFSLRKVWLRRRERNFVADSEEDLTKAKALARQGKSELNSLQEQWKAAIDTLRSSHLNKLGNPLYVLPWYLVIGESGSGKSSSLSSARLPSPISNIGRIDGVSGTRQCEWWFFEQAVVIDTAGRYATAAHEGQDKDEWQKMLSLLIKYRRKEPLNGVIVTVAADRLLEAGEVQLEKDGCTIRRRIDELMRAVGVRFPVYVLVTKCDLIQGVNRFCEHLPAQSLDQPMGIINQELSPDVDAFVEHALHAVFERLRNLRLQLLHQPQAKGADPELLLFPEEFESLKQGVVTFLTHAFGENPYQETPVLRGIFFGSGRQEGNPRSHFSRSPVQIGTEEALPGTSKGLFLHDFFAKVLPRDRSLLPPTRNSIRWRTLTGNLGLTSWVVLGVALCGLLTFSFVRNMKTIRGFSHGFSKTPPLRGDLPANLAAMERFRQDILKVEEQNRNWWIPRFGLTESIKVEKGLKEKFCRQFQTMVLTPFDKQISAGMTTISPATPDDLYAQYVVHLVRRINILKMRLAGNAPSALRENPQPEYLSSLNSPAAAGTPEARKAFGTLYLSALIWRENPVEIGKEKAMLQSWLKQLLAVKGSNLQWLTVWVDRQSGLPPVTLKDFWGGSLTATGEKTVAPAFTRKGKETVDSLVQELEAAVPDSAPVVAREADFAGWYRRAAFEAWHEFAADFAKGEERLRGPAEWQQAAFKMASEQGPYFALLGKVVLELEPLVLEAPPPPWLQQIHQFQSARAQGLVQENAAINKAAEGSKKILTTIRKNVGQEAGAHKLEAQMTTAKACKEYCSALTAIAPAVASRNQVFQLASQTFAEDPAIGKSPLYAAAASAGRLKAGISAEAADPVFNQLLIGPLQFLWSYLRTESAAQLQALWEEQVLAGTMGMTSQQAIPVLLGPDGLAWRFVKGPAAPFLNQSLSGYRAKEALGGKIAFENALFSFMNKGAKAQAAVMAMGRPQNYSVGIKGLPTDANAEAKIKPHATRLEMQCGGIIQSLANYNYPVGKTFSWSPDACGDVLFQIEVGDVVLTRHYPGQQGFPDFLKDLNGGRRTFGGREFPGEKSALDRMGVKSITVNYQFIGSGAILQQTATLSGQAPRSIARGWAH